MPVDYPHSHSINGVSVDLSQPCYRGREAERQKGKCQEALASEAMKLLTVELVELRTLRPMPIRRSSVVAALFPERNGGTEQQ